MNNTTTTTTISSFIEQRRRMYYSTREGLPPEISQAGFLWSPCRIESLKNEFTLELPSSSSFVEPLSQLVVPAPTSHLGTPTPVTSSKNAVVVGQNSHDNHHENDNDNNDEFSSSSSVLLSKRQLELIQQQREQKRLAPLISLQQQEQAAMDDILSAKSVTTTTTTTTTTKNNNSIEHNTGEQTSSTKTTSSSSSSATLHLQHQRTFNIPTGSNVSIIVPRTRSVCLRSGLFHYSEQHTQRPVEPQFLSLPRLFGVNTDEYYFNHKNNNQQQQQIANKNNINNPLFNLPSSSFHQQHQQTSSNDNKQQLSFEEKYHWCIKFNETINSGNSKERDIRLRQLTSDFIQEVVPIAMFLVTSSSALPTGVSRLHHDKTGVTYELLSRSKFDKEAYTYLSDEARKNLRRTIPELEFRSRCALLHRRPRQIKSLVVPFTVCVEFLGMTVLCSPRLPIEDFSSSSSSTQQQQQQLVAGFLNLHKTKEQDEQNELKRFEGLEFEVEREMLEERREQRRREREEEKRRRLEQIEERKKQKRIEEADKRRRRQMFGSSDDDDDDEKHDDDDNESVPEIQIDTEEDDDEEVNNEDDDDEKQYQNGNYNNSNSNTTDRLQQQRLRTEEKMKRLAELKRKQHVVVSMDSTLSTCQSSSNGGSNINISPTTDLHALQVAAEAASTFHCDQPHTVLLSDRTIQTTFSPALFPIFRSSLTTTTTSNDKEGVGMVTTNGGGDNRLYAPITRTLCAQNTLLSDPASRITFFTPEFLSGPHLPQDRLLNPDHRAPFAMVDGLLGEHTAVRVACERQRWYMVDQAGRELMRDVRVGVVDDDVFIEGGIKKFLMMESNNISVMTDQTSKNNNNINEIESLTSTSTFHSGCWGFSECELPLIVEFLHRTTFLTNEISSSGNNMYSTTTSTTDSKHKTIQYLIAEIVATAIARYLLDQSTPELDEEDACCANRRVLEDLLRELISTRKTKTQKKKKTTSQSKADEQQQQRRKATSDEEQEEGTTDISDKNTSDTKNTTTTTIITRPRTTTFAEVLEEASEDDEQQSQQQHRDGEEDILNKSITSTQQREDQRIEEQKKKMDLDEIERKRNLLTITEIVQNTVRDWRALWDERFPPSPPADEMIKSSSSPPTNSSSKNQQLQRYEFELLYSYEPSNDNNTGVNSNNFIQDHLWIPRLLNILGIRISKNGVRVTDFSTNDDDEGTIETKFSFWPNIRIPNLVPVLHHHHHHHDTLDKNTSNNNNNNNDKTNSSSSSSSLSYYYSKSSPFGDDEGEVQFYKRIARASAPAAILQQIEDQYRQAQTPAALLVLTGSSTTNSNNVVEKVTATPSTSLSKVITDVTLTAAANHLMQQPTTAAMAIRQLNKLQLSQAKEASRRVEHYLNFLKENVMNDGKISRRHLLLHQNENTGDNVDNNDGDQQQQHEQQQHSSFIMNMVGDFMSPQNIEEEDRKKEQYQQEKAMIKQLEKVIHQMKKDLMKNIVTQMEKEQNSNSNNNNADQQNQQQQPSSNNNNNQAILLDALRKKSAESAALLLQMKTSVGETVQLVNLDHLLNAKYHNNNSNTSDNNNSKPDTNDETKVLKGEQDRDDKDTSNVKQQESSSNKSLPLDELFVLTGTRGRRLILEAVVLADSSNSNSNSSNNTGNEAAVVGAESNSNINESSSSMINRTVEIVVPESSSSPTATTSVNIHDHDQKQKKRSNNHHHSNKSTTTRRRNSNTTTTSDQHHSQVSLHDTMVIRYGWCSLGRSTFSLQTQRNMPKSWLRSMSMPVEHPALVLTQSGYRILDANLSRMFPGFEEIHKDFFSLTEEEQQKKIRARSRAEQNRLFDLLRQQSVYGVWLMTTGPKAGRVFFLRGCVRHDLFLHEPCGFVEVLRDCPTMEEIDRQHAPLFLGTLFSESSLARATTDLLSEKQRLEEYNKKKEEERASKKKDNNKNDNTSITIEKQKDEDEEDNNYLLLSPATATSKDPSIHYWDRMNSLDDEEDDNNNDHYHYHKASSSLSSSGLTSSSFFILQKAMQSNIKAINDAADRSPGFHFDKFDIVTSFSRLSKFSFRYKHIIKFLKGPYKDMSAVVLGCDSVTRELCVLPIESRWSRMYRTIVAEEEEALLQKEERKQQGLFAHEQMREKRRRSTMMLQRRLSRRTSSMHGSTASNNSSTSFRTDTSNYTSANLRDLMLVRQDDDADEEKQQKEQRQQEHQQRKNSHHSLFEKRLHSFLQKSSDPFASSEKKKKSNTTFTQEQQQQQEDDINNNNNNILSHLFNKKRQRLPAAGVILSLGSDMSRITRLHDPQVEGVWNLRESDIPDRAEKVHFRGVFDVELVTNGSSSGNNNSRTSPQQQQQQRDDHSSSSSLLLQEPINFAEPVHLLKNAYATMTTCGLLVGQRVKVVAGMKFGVVGEFIGVESRALRTKLKKDRFRYYEEYFTNHLEEEHDEEENYDNNNDDDNEDDDNNEQQFAQLLHQEEANYLTKGIPSRCDEDDAKVVWIRQEVVVEHQQRELTEVIFPVRRSCIVVLDEETILPSEDENEASNNNNKQRTFLTPCGKPIQVDVGSVHQLSSSTSTSNSNNNNNDNHNSTSTSVPLFPNPSLTQFGLLHGQLVRVKCDALAYCPHEEDLAKMMIENGRRNARLEKAMSKIASAQQQQQQYSRQEKKKQVLKKNDKNKNDSSSSSSSSFTSTDASSSYHSSDEDYEEVIFEEGLRQQSSGGSLPLEAEEAEEESEEDHDNNDNDNEGDVFNEEASSVFGGSNNNNKPPRQKRGTMTMMRRRSSTSAVQFVENYMKMSRKNSTTQNTKKKQQQRRSSAATSRRNKLLAKRRKSSVFSGASFLVPGTSNQKKSKEQKRRKSTDIDEKKSHHHHHHHHHHQSSSSSPSNSNNTSTDQFKVLVSIVGVYNNELWVQVENEPVVRPVLGMNAFSLRCETFECGHIPVEGYQQTRSLHDHLLGGGLWTHRSSGSSKSSKRTTIHTSIANEYSLPFTESVANSSWRRHFSIFAKRKTYFGGGGEKASSSKSAIIKSRASYINNNNNNKSQQQQQQHALFNSFGRSFLKSTRKVNMFVGGVGSPSSSPTHASSQPQSKNKPFESSFLRRGSTNHNSSSRNLLASVNGYSSMRGKAFSLAAASLSTSHHHLHHTRRRSGNDALLENAIMHNSNSSTHSNNNNNKNDSSMNFGLQSVTAFPFLLNSQPIQEGKQQQQQQQSTPTPAAASKCSKRFISFLPTSDENINTTTRKRLDPRNKFSPSSSSSLSTTKKIMETNSRHLLDIDIPDEDESVCVADYLFLSDSSAFAADCQPSNNNNSNNNNNNNSTLPHHQDVIRIGLDTRQKSLFLLNHHNHSSSSSNNTNNKSHQYNIPMTQLSPPPKQNKNDKTNTISRYQQLLSSSASSPVIVKHFSWSIGSILIPQEMADLVPCDNVREPIRIAGTWDGSLYVTSIEGRPGKNDVVWILPPEEVRTWVPLCELMVMMQSSSSSSSSLTETTTTNNNPNKLLLKISKQNLEIIKKRIPKYVLKQYYHSDACHLTLLAASEQSTNPFQSQLLSKAAHVFKGFLPDAATIILTAASWLDEQQQQQQQQYGDDSNSNFYLNNDNNVVMSNFDDDDDITDETDAQHNNDDQHQQTISGNNKNEISSSSSFLAGSSNEVVDRSILKYALLHGIYDPNEPLVIGELPFCAVLVSDQPYFKTQIASGTGGGGDFSNSKHEFQAFSSPVALRLASGQTSTTTTTASTTNNNTNSKTTNSNIQFHYKLTKLPRFAVSRQALVCGERSRITQSKMIVVDQLRGGSTTTVQNHNNLSTTSLKNTSFTSNHNSAHHHHSTTTSHSGEPSKIEYEGDEGTLYLNYEDYSEEMLMLQTQRQQNTTMPMPTTPSSHRQQQDNHHQTGFTQQNNNANHSLFSFSASNVLSTSSLLVSSSPLLPNHNHRQYTILPFLFFKHRHDMRYYKQAFHQWQDDKERRRRSNRGTSAGSQQNHQNENEFTSPSSLSQSLSLSLSLSTSFMNNNNNNHNNSNHNHDMTMMTAAATTSTKKFPVHWHQVTTLRRACKHWLRVDLGKLSPKTFSLLQNMLIDELQQQHDDDSYYLGVNSYVADGEVRTLGSSELMTTTTTTTAASGTCNVKTMFMCVSSSSSSCVLQRAHQLATSSRIQMSLWSDLLITATSSSSSSASASSSDNNNNNKNKKTFIETKRRLVRHHQPETAANEEDSMMTELELHSIQSNLEKLLSTIGVHVPKRGRLALTLPPSLSTTTTTATSHPTNQDQQQQQQQSSASTHHFFENEQLKQRRRKCLNQIIDQLIQIIVVAEQRLGICLSPLDLFSPTNVPLLSSTSLATATNNNNNNNSTILQQQQTRSNRSRFSTNIQLERIIIEATKARLINNNLENSISNINIMHLLQKSLIFCSSSTRASSTSTLTSSFINSFIGRPSLELKLQQQHTGGSATSSSYHRYVSSDRGLVLLRAECPPYPWKRGNIVKYTRGDLSGMLAVILGWTDEGICWRRELESTTTGGNSGGSGSAFSHRALRLHGSLCASCYGFQLAVTDSMLQKANQIHNLDSNNNNNARKSVFVPLRATGKRRSSIVGGTMMMRTTMATSSSSSSSHLSEETLPSCDEFMWLTYEGYWKAFDISEEACGSFGVSFGARIRCLDSSLTIDDFDPKLLKSLVAPSLKKQQQLLVPHHREKGGQSSSYSVSSPSTKNKKPKNKKTKTASTNNTATSRRTTFVAFEEAEMVSSSSDDHDDDANNNDDNSSFASDSSSSLSSSDSDNDTQDENSLLLQNIDFRASDTNNDIACYPMFYGASGGGTRTKSGGTPSSSFSTVHNNTKLVLTVLGVCEDHRLWVCADHTGAFPLSLSPTSQFVLNKQDELIQLQQDRYDVLFGKNNNNNIQKQRARDHFISETSTLVNLPTSLMPPISILYYGGVSLLTHPSAIGTALPCTGEELQDEKLTLFPDTICRMDTNIVREEEAELLFSSSSSGTNQYSPSSSSVYHQQQSGSRRVNNNTNHNNTQHQLLSNPLVDFVLTTDLLFETDPRIVSSFCRDHGLVPIEPYSNIPLVTGRKFVINFTSSTSTSSATTTKKDTDDKTKQEDDTAINKKRRKSSTTSLVGLDGSGAGAPRKNPLHFLTNQKLTIVGIRLGALYVCKESSSVANQQQQSSTSSKQQRSSGGGNAFPFPLAAYLTLLQKQQYYNINIKNTNNNNTNSSNCYYYHLSIHPSDPSMIYSMTHNPSTTPPHQFPPPAPPRPPGMSDPVSWQSISSEITARQAWFRFPLSDGGSTIGEFDTFESSLDIYNVVHGEVVTYNLVGGGAGRKTNNNNKQHSSDSSSSSSDQEEDEDNNNHNTTLTTTKSSSAGGGKLVVAVVIGVREGSLWVADLFSLSTSLMQFLHQQHQQQPQRAVSSSSSSLSLSPVEQYLREQDQNGEFERIVKQIACQITFDNLANEKNMTEHHHHHHHHHHSVNVSSSSSPSLEENIVVARQQVGATALFGCRDARTLEKNVNFKSRRKIVAVPSFQ